MTTPSDAGVSPVTARKTWRTVEPVHAMIYFAHEAAASYAALGIDPTAGYFASRSAPMGAFDRGTVVAAFYNFSPVLVGAAIPAAWETARPVDVVAARLAAADAALRRMLGEAIGSDEMARAAELARRAGLRAAERPGGRPLFAGHAGLPWPEPAHLVLWHAQTLLREFRGDGHVATLLTAGVDPVEALVLHAASGEVPVPFLKATRGWSEEQWDAGADRLRDRGWLEVGPADGRLSLTETGLAARQDIEDRTDRLAVYPYEALGDAGCDELRRLTRPFSQAVVGAGGLGR